MLSDEEKDNVFKISVPIITNEELERLDYTIENNLDNIVHQISETVSKDRDIIILKKVIKKQSKEIEELKDFNTKLQATKDRLDSYDKENTLEIEKLKKEIEELKEQCKEVVCIPEGTCFMLEPKDVDKKWKDKIKAKIEELKREKEKYFEKQVIQHEIAVLQSLLEKE